MIIFLTEANFPFDFILIRTSSGNFTLLVIGSISIESRVFPHCVYILPVLDTLARLHIRIKPPTCKVLDSIAGELAQLTEWFFPERQSYNGMACDAK